MSLRRSARVQALPTPPKDEDAVTSTAPLKKRARRSDGSDALAMPPPETPVKRRRKAADDAAPPPFTPTPSAIVFMTSTTPVAKNYSCGDIDDATPPPDRPAEPHHTNATLMTPGGTQVLPAYSNFEDSTSKTSTNGVATTTTRCMLDEACEHLISVDEKLRPVIEQHRCRVFSPEGLAEEIDPFRSLASGIMAQQVSGAAAKSIKNKFIGLFPSEKCPNGFPTPVAVTEMSLPTLRTVGLSQRKAEYIQGLAEKFVSGELSVDMLMQGSDEEVMEKLVAVRGLGVWSVQMFMCFGLKRMDVFSTGDLGVQRGMAALIGKDVKKMKASGKGKWKYMSEADMLELSEKFAPYR